MDASEGSRLAMLMLLKLNTCNAHTDADLCIRIVSFCFKNTSSGRLPTKGINVYSELTNIEGIEEMDVLSRVRYLVLLVRVDNPSIK